LLGLGVVIAGVAGLYPALHLSGFSPKLLLNPSYRANTGSGLLRRGLVVVQFTASLVLAIGTLLFYQQLQFIQQRRLGYDPAQVVAITTTAAQTTGQVEGLKADLRALSGVEAVARAQTYPGRGGSGRTITKTRTETTGMSITTCRATSDVLKTLGLKLLAGSSLPPRSDKSDTNAESDTTVQVVLNKTAVTYLGYTPQQAIGKIAPNLFGNSAEIVGVVDDFHFASLHQPIGAYGFHNANSEGRPYMLVRTQTGNLPETMRQLEAVYHKHLPDAAFEYTFLDQHLNKLYRNEQRTGQVVLLFAGLAILIACLGLFGLATFTAEQRTKEISIRKVLGASIFSLVGLLSKDFLKLVVLAIVIASPLAWWAMTEWLGTFAYRVELAWWVFALAGTLALLIALLTVSFQSIRAALMNPVKSLRSE
jgi:putative ABC transport system permease protein